MSVVVMGQQKRSGMLTAPVFAFDAAGPTPDAHRS
eukprot:CAMPEP_0181235104 /NCGR_PEP_ID=MMETSP1096-20121128/37378_1 /TAXON_ID=156174 ORGANISM="Chrysochromulina ericina, Strain CCMP281" /NCGR_SAMPLE_ID=MMETSP1096 /ASSEMBLY_ACC=CAM_ASM_000453 /LENGTH=34 /DNA_ID= /DNA_START= /DNA_END= /DNA_ORIENTATION=